MPVPLPRRQLPFEQNRGIFVTPPKAAYEAFLQQTSQRSQQIVSGHQLGMGDDSQMDELSYKLC
jgi:hypothetical protein